MSYYLSEMSREQHCEKLNYDWFWWKKPWLALQVGEILIEFSTNKEKRQIQIETDTFGHGFCTRSSVHGQSNGVMRRGGSDL